MLLVTQVTVQEVVQKATASAAAISASALSVIPNAHLKILVANITPELWDIFKGKCHSARHEQYSDGGESKSGSQNYGASNRVWGHDK